MIVYRDLCEATKLTSEALDEARTKLRLVKMKGSIISDINRRFIHTIISMV